MSQTSLQARIAAAERPMALDGWLRERLLRRLAGLRHGALEIDDAWGHARLGDQASAAAVRLSVDDPRFFRALAFNGSVGAGAAYADGLWRCDDLVGLVRLLVRNRDLLDAMETGPARLGAAALRAWHAARDNTRDGARRNIAAHYDLGNDFFSLFLSPDLMYSSALWAEDDTLEQASTRKLETICRKLDLQPGQRVVEIGTGWGGFALHAARRHGCHVTTTTISQEQFDLASARVQQAGLQERVTVLLRDYRDLEGQYDRLVSIEMIEAIGARWQETYFGKLASLLSGDGLALVQAITIEDHRYAQALHSVDFIKRHVFPGSFIPSVQAMLAAKTRASDLQLVHLEDFGLSYARTLRAWRERFMGAREQAKALGYEERFLRLWEFYLAYCEGGFLERSIGVSHLLLARPGARPAHGDRWVAAEAG
ncbi:cyclopropane-fatty-acyl-phospholipid synthase family protein [Pseudoxanthomonas daejeonensis]|uniref:SAM-dependent methyltransferase n=1 Tax=Pseudoxanthomonas daejeonensis TaxID=266062 RepID=UPI001F5456AE|nr:cyclopropane-fatty-acyl-phospholipid synthase family protein [Pseudoxanthomonas daejeonensis]UNK58591.1 cyclopropane-fatty-acyl-phospholipid synthase family protein [Pseudoxanthomonas daejeonensis]